MAVARAAQNAAAAALFKALGIEPFLDSFEADGSFSLVFHEYGPRRTENS